MQTEPPKTAPIPNGIAIAACLAAMIGMLTLGIVAFACEMSKPLTATVHNIGKIWMPGADGIGPYSGKETLALLAWLVSWPVLHFLLHKKQLLGGFWLVVFLLGVGVATTLVWPPIWHLLPANIDRQSMMAPPDRIGEIDPRRIDDRRNPQHSHPRPPARPLDSAVPCRLDSGHAYGSWWS